MDRTAKVLSMLFLLVRKVPSILIRLRSVKELPKGCQTALISLNTFECVSHNFEEPSNANEG